MALALHPAARRQLDLRGVAQPRGAAACSDV